MSHNAFKKYHSHRVEVHREGVVPSRHYLGGHIAGSATCILFILGFPDFSDPKVRYVEIALRVKDQILRFYISVDDVLIVDVFEGESDAGDPKFEDFFGKFSVFDDVKTQITSFHVFHNEK
jgi:hypothetical protein